MASPDPVADRIRLIRDNAGNPGDLTRNDYQRGFYNGLELALSVLEDRQPVYIEPCGPSERMCIACGREISFGDGDWHSMNRGPYHRGCMPSQPSICHN
ncbi:MAG: hypothetical protein J2P30_00050 [Actinobacteria bacterium]|nr:hypothetical protein [Actinomycetota bacterium]